MLKRIDTCKIIPSFDCFNEISDEIYSYIQEAFVPLRGLDIDVKTTPQKRPYVTIFTDGSWKDKTKSGAWCALMTYKNEWKLLTCGQIETTINRMELSAVIEGLKHLKEPCDVLIISDSQLVVNIINQFVYIWPKKNFISSKGTPVLNQDLVKELIEWMKIHNVKAKWVKSHTGFKDEISKANDICDFWAQQSADRVGGLVEKKDQLQKDVQTEVDKLVEKKPKKKFCFWKNFHRGKKK